jgi:hypothetical protein
MALKKIDKEYCFTDESVNDYGFRLLTSGYQLPEFQKNPIGYYMHSREDGVVVSWSEFRIEGDKVFAKPSINLSNKRGEQTADEVENGFLNGASVGHIVVLESSMEPEMMVPGQTGPTITKWFNRELSLCDIPGNMNGLCLYNNEGELINLSTFKNQKIQMEKIILTHASLIALSLTADATQTAVDTAITNLATKAANVDSLTVQLNAANTAKKTAETGLETLKKETTAKEIAANLAAAVTATKMTQAQSDLLAINYAGKPVELAAYIDTLQPQASVISMINNSTVKNLAAEYKDKTWNELDRIDGALANLKAADIDLFKQKFKAEFKKEYTGK